MLVITSLRVWRKRLVLPQMVQKKGKHVLKWNGIESNILFEMLGRSSWTCIFELGLNPIFCYFWVFNWCFSCVFSFSFLGVIFLFWEYKGMFGNYFFPLFSVFKNNFLFLRLKNLFGNSKWVENKNCFQNSNL